MSGQVVMKTHLGGEGRVSRDTPPPQHVLHHNVTDTQSCYSGSVLSQAGVLGTVRVLGPFSTYLVVRVRVPVNVFGPVSVLSPI